MELNAGKGEQVDKEENLATDPIIASDPWRSPEISLPVAKVVNSFGEIFETPKVMELPAIKYDGKIVETLVEAPQV